MNVSGKVVRLARSVSRRFAFPDDVWAAQFLSGGELRVFLDMDPRDREHGVRVARHLLARHPAAPPELVAGALLHDCGKSVRPYKVWERVLAGLLPQRLNRAVNFGPLRVRAQHPQSGAELLRAVGARERVAQLVERHHAPGADAEAALLHRLDGLE